MFDKDRLTKGINDIIYWQNADCSKNEIVRKFVALVKRCSGLDAVGLRLKEGEDYPYYTTIGFTDSFVMAESRVCAGDDDGNVVRDPSGLACLDCMCGNVLRGRTDPKMPFFTEGGSFCS